MTMDNMVKAFEKEGFIVKKVYNHTRQVYEFSIEKDGHGYHADFHYPNSVNAAVVDQAQKNFIDQSIRNFNDAFAGYMIDGLWPKTNPYVKTDVLDALKYAMEPLSKLSIRPDITNVEFNPPLTVVIWSDKTKTFVRTQDDEPFDPEKGLAMAIAKKFLGNNGGYFDEFKKWLKKNEERTKKKEHKALKKSEPIGKVIAKNVTDQAVTFTAKLSDSDAIKSILCHDDSGKFTLSFDAVKIEKELPDITVCESGWDDFEMPSALIPMDVFVETGADLIELIEIVKSGIEDNGFFTLNEYYDFSGYSVTDDPQSKQYDISKYGWTEPPIFRTKFYDDGFLLKASAAKLLEVNK